MSVRLFSVLVIVLLTIGLWACHKQSHVYIKRIDNKSSKTLKFRFHGFFNPLTYGKIITVYPGEVKEILYYSERNRYSRRTQNCHIYRDSIESVVVGGGRLRKRMSNHQDWYFMQHANNQICTFEVTDNDIE